MNSRSPYRPLKPHPSPGVNSIEYHVPNTDTTLFLVRTHYAPAPYSTLRVILSQSMTEVECIIDIAGDGPLPGPSHAYRRKYFDEHGVYETIELVIESSYPTGPEGDLMTYGILHDALWGLWECLIVARWGTAFGEFWVQHGSKGMVGLGYFVTVSAEGQLKEEMRTSMVTKEVSKSLL
ncbi:MAG: hypothetical protein L6R39_000831 [Caloplaca ligustica]|nr:MAG: hypothetical protein L6R39_000831 [Caloplaca ligustica]